METLSVHMGDMVNAIPTHIGEMVTTILKENLQENTMFSLASELADKTVEVRMMQRYFKKVKDFPDFLVSHNNAFMQKAYLEVSQDSWMTRVLDLQQALQSFRNGEIARRRMVTQSPLENMSASVRANVDQAFVQKYEELMPRVLNDFNDFFPYAIDKINPQVTVFKKMGQFELIEYVMRQF